MRIHRLLSPQSIRLGLRAEQLPDPDPELSESRKLWYWKTPILEELVELLDEAGGVSHARKLVADLTQIEKKASTAIGDGIAVPHVRSKHARAFTIGFVRTERPLPFDALDGEPVRIFIPHVAPPYDDREYHRFQREIAGILLQEGCREALEEAQSGSEVVRILQEYSPW